MTTTKEIDALDQAATAAIVLCGGQSKRMGQDKCWLQLDGEYLLQRVCRIISQVVDPEHIVVVAADQQVLPSLPEAIMLVRDETPACGPLAGMQRGLSEISQRFSPQTPTFVTACDLPGLKPDVILFLLQQLGEHEAVAFRDDQTTHPLCAVYRASLSSVAATLLQRDERRVRALSSNCDCHFINTSIALEFDPNLQSLRNVNTPEDFQAFTNEFLCGK